MIRFVAHCNGVVGACLLLFAAHGFGAALAGAAEWAMVFWSALVGAMSIAVALRGLKGNP